MHQRAVKMKSEEGTFEHEGTNEYEKGKGGVIER